MAQLSDPPPSAVDARHVALVLHKESGWFPHEQICPSREQASPPDGGLAGHGPGAAASAGAVSTQGQQYSTTPAGVGMGNIEQRSEGSGATLCPP